MVFPLSTVDVLASYWIIRSIPLTVLFRNLHWWQAPAFLTSLAAFLTGASSFRRCLTVASAPGSFSNTRTNSESFLWGLGGDIERLFLEDGSGDSRLRFWAGGSYEISLLDGRPGSWTLFDQSNFTVGEDDVGSLESGDTLVSSLKGRGAEYRTGHVEGCACTFALKVLCCEYSVTPTFEDPRKRSLLPGTCWVSCRF